MQTHKKWLIITIWIATIAFIGAGFVGWGAYSYGKKQDEVARIKDTSIKVKDIQNIYSELYNKLNQIMGGKLDEATAKQFGLEKQAFKEALKEAMLIQFAKDNGLYITNEELAKALIEIPAFHKNGKFDKKLYKQYLSNTRQTAEEFESNLKKQLLIFKISQALNIPSTTTLQDTIASYFFMEDKISIKTINSPKIEVTEEEIKNYWQKHKDNYKSPLTYNIGYFYVSLNANTTEAEINNYYDEHKTNYTDENGKILPLKDVKDKVKTDLLAKKTKKEAILTMKKLKNKELQFKEANNVTLENEYISTQNMQKLVTNKFLKPTLTDKGWLIATLIKINNPKPLDYEKAKNLAKKDLIIEKRKQTLIKLAKENLNNFEGKNIGFVGRDDLMKFKNLSVNEASIFLTSLFNSKTPNGYVLLPQEAPTKVILFKITEQKLLNISKYDKLKKIVVVSANKLKIEQLNKNLIKELERIYQSQIKIFMKI
jgi:peptidyl-prolyl cis-trans isomerase D